MENILLISLMLLPSSIVHSQSANAWQKGQLLCPEEVFCASSCNRQAKVKAQCNITIRNFTIKICDCETKDEAKDDECPKSREACMQKCHPHMKKAMCNGTVCECS